MREQQRGRDEESKGEDERKREREGGRPGDEGFHFISEMDGISGAIESEDGVYWSPWDKVEPVIELAAEWQHCALLLVSLFSFFLLAFFSFASVITTFFLFPVSPLFISQLGPLPLPLLPMAILVM